MDIAIRPWQPSDAATLAPIMADPAIRAHLRDGLPEPYTTADAEEYINTMLAAPKDSIYPFAVTVDGALVGSIAITRGVNIHHRTAELGYCLAREWWGKGIMSEAVPMACKEVMDNTDMLRIYAEPFASNFGSCRVLEKAGFKLEGVLRSNAIKNGVVKDMCMYSLVK